MAHPLQGTKSRDHNDNPTGGNVFKKCSLEKMLQTSTNHALLPASIRIQLRRALLLTILHPPFPADADCCFGSQSLHQLANKKGFCRFTTTPLLKQRKRVRLGLIKVIRSRSPPKAAWYCTPKNVISDIFHITVSRAQPSSVASICLECSPPESRPFKLSFPLSNLPAPAFL